MQHARKPKMTIQSKVIIAAIIAIIAIIIGLVVHFHKPVETLEDETPTTTTVTTTTSITQSEKDISAMVDEMVEAKLAEKLAEMTSTTEATQVVETTVTTVAPEEVTTTVEPEEVTTATEGITADVEDETLTENGLITIFQGNASYTISCKSDLYEAAFYSTYSTIDGRDLSIQVPDDVTSISVAFSIRTEDNNLSKLSDFEELVLTQAENGLEAQYSIPDNPLRDDGRWPLECPSFYGVFRLDTTEGCEYFAISY